jgi:putative FmdB family regulatory protein
MPLFEYRCTGCDHRFEALVRGSEAPACPSCRGVELEKLFSAFAVGGAESPQKFAGPAPCGSCGDPRGPGACSMKN